MTIWNRQAHTFALLAAGSCVGLGILIALAELYGLAAFLGIAGGVMYFAMMNRSFRRLRLARLTLPYGWKEILQKRVPFYRDLAPDRRAEFERDVNIFIRENRFVGIKDQEVTDELKVLASASAVMLLFGRTDRDFPRISEILFYPDTFSDDYRTRGRGRDIAGQVHPYGAVILSVPELLRGFAIDSDGSHVGLHEFAHVLDLEALQFDGVPAGMDPRMMQPWTERMREEMKRAGGKRSAIRAYGGTNEAEFFAVAVEVFFERPELLEKKNPEVYGLLKQYFRPNRPGTTPSKEPPVP